MAAVVRVHETGGPEVLRFEAIEPGRPGPGQVLLRQTAVGLNYIDVYFRSGVYPPPALPFTPGLEAAGVVEEVGSEVGDISVGQRVAYAAPPLGAYAEQRLMPADRLVPLPDAIRDEQAAAMMLKGMTAHYLLRRTFPVQRGQTILFHAVAGGVGLIACQWAKHLGATVIGTVGSAEKAELARAHGCDHPIRYDREDVVSRVKEITDGKGVPVVYDSVGKDTFDRSLDCLAPLGMMVSFGQSSGNVPPLNLGILSQKGSLFVTRPTLMTYTSARADLLKAAGELFDVVGKGAVRIEINQRFALRDAAAAHRALESRKTTGSTILQPWSTRRPAMEPDLHPAHDPDHPGVSAARIYRKRRGRPSRARGQPNSSDAAIARWTIRGVPPPVRDMALKAAEGRGMTVGDWVAEAIVSFARRAAQERPRSQLPATDPPPDLADLVHRLDQRLARLEAREQRGFFGRLFGGRS